MGGLQGSAGQIRLEVAPGPARGLRLKGWPTGDTELLQGLGPWGRSLSLGRTLLGGCWRQVRKRTGEGSSHGVEHGQEPWGIWGLQSGDWLLAGLSGRRGVELLWGYGAFSSHVLSLGCTQGEAWAQVWGGRNRCTG